MQEGIGDVERMILFEVPPRPFRWKSKRSRVVPSYSASKTALSFVTRKLVVSVMQALCFRLPWLMQVVYQTVVVEKTSAASLVSSNRSSSHGIMFMQGLETSRSGALQHLDEAPHGPALPPLSITINADKTYSCRLKVLAV